MLRSRYEVGKGFVPRRLGIVSISTLRDFLREGERKERIKEGRKEWKNKTEKQRKLAENKQIRKEIKQNTSREVRKRR